MNKVRFAIGFLAALLVSTSFASVAHAQTTRTYVSAIKGDDNNACTVDKPCRTFQKAIDQVMPGGDVVALDSGEYDSFTVNKSVAVQSAPGVYVGVGPPGPSASAIQVNIAATDAVTIRGLTFNGVGQSYAQGIYFSAGGGTLCIENCVINGCSSGVSYHGSGYLFVKDTIVRNGSVGIYVEGDSTLNLPARASIDRCRFEKNYGTGLVAAHNSRVTVRDSIAAGGNNGFFTEATLNKFTQLNIDNCIATGNNFGIGSYQSGGSAVVRVSNATVTNNSTGLYTVGGAILLSRGNNTVEGNNTNGAFTGMFQAK